MKWTKKLLHEAEAHSGKRCSVEGAGYAAARSRREQLVPRDFSKRFLIFFDFATPLASCIFPFHRHHVTSR